MNDFWDTPMGIAQDFIDRELMEKEVEEANYASANKGE